MSNPLRDRTGPPCVLTASIAVAGFVVLIVNNHVLGIVIWAIGMTCMVAAYAWHDRLHRCRGETPHAL